MNTIEIEQAGREAAEFATTHTGDPHEWSGRAIVEGGRVWVEVRPAPGASGDWTPTWFCADGHAAETPEQIFAGEAAWLI